MKVLSILTALLLVLPVPASPQTSSSTALSPQRDPQAVALAQQSLAAMGGAQALSLGDSLATGQIQSFRSDGTSVTFPVTKKSKGTKMLRTEVQRPEGTRLIIINNGVGAVQKPDGTSRSLFSNNTVAARVAHIPALSFLSEWQSSTTEIRFVRSDTLNTRPVQVIALCYIPTSDPHWVGSYRTTTQTLFYIDQATSTVTKIEYQNFAESDSNVSEKIELFFTDYRSISGVLVPFTQTSYADGRLRTTLTLSSVAFNTSLPDSQFVVPGGN